MRPVEDVQPAGLHSLPVSTCDTMSQHCSLAGRLWSEVLSRLTISITAQDDILWNVVSRLVPEDIASVEAATSRLRAVGEYVSKALTWSTKKFLTR